MVPAPAVDSHERQETGEETVSASLPAAAAGGGGGGTKEQVRQARVHTGNRGGGGAQMVITFSLLGSIYHGTSGSGDYRT